MMQLGLFEHAPASAAAAPRINPGKLGRVPPADEVGNWHFRVEGADRQGRSHFQFLARWDATFGAACADAAETSLRVLGFSAVTELVLL
jgi:hypothetical protein